MTVLKLKQYKYILGIKYWFISPPSTIYHLSLTA